MLCLRSTLEKGSSVKIISQSEFVEIVELCHEFEGRGPGGGYSFNCDENGKVILNNPHAALNYYKCLSGAHDVIDCGIQRYERGWYNAGVGLCECGEEVTLSAFTNPCDCGRDYNSSGCLLAPRSQWGEETGESLGDILSV